MTADPSLFIGIPGTTASGLGRDASVNQPSLPVVGSNFGGSGPYANYALVKTIPADATRRLIDVENNSGAQIVIVRDDGTAATGAAPANASVFALAGGSGVGSQGGSFVSTTFGGRLQIYAPAATTPQIAILID